MHVVRVMYNLLSSDVREMAFIHSLVVRGNRLRVIMLNDTEKLFLQYRPMKIRAVIFTDVGLLMCTPGCLGSLNICLFLMLCTMC